MGPLPHVDCFQAHIRIGASTLAGQPLFDISQIDKTKVAVSAEEVGRLNPQCGAMRLLDHIIWMTPDGSQALGVKQVRTDEFWVPYHIPGRPLMPGVLMIEAGAQLSSIQYKRRSGNLAFLGFIRCDEVVFRGQVVPGDTLYLLGKEVSFGGRRFISAVQGMVGDKLMFEAKITGMVL
jgi:3-hydroxyacyl-[acyl-carrier-protein] dehydratase